MILAIFALDAPFISAILYTYEHSMRCYHVYNHDYSPGTRT